MFLGFLKNILGRIIMYEIFESLLKANKCRAVDVAKATGISQTVFSEWKKGKSNPKIDKLQKIADFFGVGLAPRLWL